MNGANFDGMRADKTYSGRFDINYFLKAISISSLLFLILRGTYYVFHFYYAGYFDIAVIVLSMAYAIIKHNTGKNKKNIFQTNYQNEISQKCIPDSVEYFRIFKEQKMHFFIFVMGLISLAFGVYVLAHQAVFGLVFVWSGTIVVYSAIRPRKIYFKLSKQGIWMKDYGFIYYRHIASFECYSITGKFSGEGVKIFIYNYKLYKMEAPFLIQSITSCENMQELKTLLPQVLLNYKTKKGYRS